MRSAFFVSSAGDTDLAKATIAQMRAMRYAEEIFIIPLTQTAIDRTQTVIDASVKRVVIPAVLDKEILDEAALQAVLESVAENNIECAYIGVASSNAESPYQIASSLTQRNIACVIAYEYMFTPQEHALWKYRALLSNPNAVVAVPLESAKKDFTDSNTCVISHLSIDRALTDTHIDTATHRQSLLAAESDQLVFISGTTQPTAVDNSFLEALLTELSTGRYQNIQIRFGLHPGIRNFDDYLSTLLETCSRYPAAASHLKIILPTAIESRLQRTTIPQSHPFILRCNISGADAANASENVAQAVPGALLNEAALRGKPVYCHNPVEPYLPATWFSRDLPTFFASKSGAPHTRTELGLSETCPEKMSQLMMTKA